MCIKTVRHIEVHMVLLVIIGLVAVVLGVAVSVCKSACGVLPPVHLYLLARQTVPRQIRLLFAAERKQIDCSLAVLPS
jgi:hypothetical protein